MNNSPTDKQINNSELMGWTYEGEGIFFRGEQIGYFTVSGFRKEDA